MCNKNNILKNQIFYNLQRATREMLAGPGIFDALDLDEAHLSVAHPSAEAIAWPWRGGPKSRRPHADATGSPSAPKAQPRRAWRLQPRSAAASPAQQSVVASSGPLPQGGAEAQRP